jgi:hypothetical protein
VNGSNGSQLGHAADKRTFVQQERHGAGKHGKRHWPQRKWEVWDWRRNSEADSALKG